MCAKFGLRICNQRGKLCTILYFAVLICRYYRRTFLNEFWTNSEPLNSRPLSTPVGLRARRPSMASLSRTPLTCAYTCLGNPSIQAQSRLHPPGQYSHHQRHPGPRYAEVVQQPILGLPLSLFLWSVHQSDGFNAVASNAVRYLGRCNSFLRSTRAKFCAKTSFGSSATNCIQFGQNKPFLSQPIHLRSNRRHQSKRQGPLLLCAWRVWVQDPKAR